MLRIIATALISSVIMMTSCAYAQDAPQVGDYGFRHHEFHNLYQKLYPKFFGKDKCHCSHGNCRPSVWRNTQLKAGGDVQLQVYVNRAWCNVPTAVQLKKHQLEADDWSALFEIGYSAHVCAYRDAQQGSCPTIECVVILSDS